MKYISRLTESVDTFCRQFDGFRVAQKNAFLIAWTNAREVFRRKSAKGGLRVFHAILTAAALVPNIAHAELRDWRTWPFSRTSPWNMPIGSGARFDAIPRLRTIPAGINYADRWTSSVVISSDSDPLVHVLTNTTWHTSNWAMLSGGIANCRNPAAVEALVRHSVAESHDAFSANPWSSLAPVEKNWKLPQSYHKATQDFRSVVRLRPGVCPSPDTDGLMADFQPDGWVLDTYATIVLSNGDIVSGGVASFIDAHGDGTGWWNGRRASMIPSFAGLIRNGEIAAGNIPHALAMVMSTQMLAKQAVWPAFAFDRNSSAYHGDLPMGTLLAIPQDIDISRLGLTKAGMALAKAAQDYGIYIVDSTRGDGATIMAELNDPDLHWQGEHKDLALVVHSLERVSNNTSATPGGPGSRRAPMAPDFAN